MVDLGYKTSELYVVITERYRTTKCFCVGSRGVAVEARRAIVLSPNKITEARVSFLSSPELKKLGFLEKKIRF